MVVPGTPRDSLHILDALLNLDGGVKSEVVATDNASYFDMVFGLFKILGCHFSPRFRDLNDQRLWRATMPGVEKGSHGAPADRARNRVNLTRVNTHWPDMLKVAGTLVTNQVHAHDLLRMLGCDDLPTPLGAAFVEYGRMAKTEHLLRVVDPVDDTYRQQMNRQLTVQESRHKLARDVRHGSAAPSTKHTGTGRRTSSARSAWSSTPSCCGPRSTSTPSPASFTPKATSSETGTSPASRRSSTAT